MRTESRRLNEITPATIGARIRPTSFHPALHSRDHPCDGCWAGAAGPPGSTSATPVSFGDLTDREFEVFRALAAGLNNREMADALFIGEATVKTHVTRVFRKLNVRDRVQAVVLAYDAGVVQPQSAPTRAPLNAVGVAQRSTPARP